MCSRPFTSSVDLLWIQFNTLIFWYWRAQSWTQVLRCNLTSAKCRGTVTVLFLMATLILIQTRMSFSFLAAWANSGSRSTSCHQYHFQQFFSHSSPNQYCCLGLSWPKYRILDNLLWENYLPDRWRQRSWCCLLGLHSDLWRCLVRWWNMGRINSEVDWKLSKQLGPEGGDQWQKV